MLGWFKRKLKKEDHVIKGQPDIDGIKSEAESSSPEIADIAPSSSSAPEGVVKQETMPVDIDEGKEEPAEKSRKSLAQRLRERLSKSREGFVSRMDNLLRGRKKIDPELFEDLEEILISADLGVLTTHDLLEKGRSRVKRDALSDPATLKGVLQETILEYLQDSVDNSPLTIPEHGPLVIMVVGVNGVGKTTTIGKIAHKFKQSGQSVLLVAADTFRAAAVEQLQIWGERTGVEVVSAEAGADPSSVVYDGFDTALKKKCDVVIVDTAGRLHTRTNLMEELMKIKRVMAKKIPDAPHEVLLVLDATTGQNSVSQMKLFNEAVGITGLALTKLDGTAKGGIVVNICHEFNIPIRFIGIGEKMEDLRDFNATEFVEALFGKNEQD